MMLKIISILVIAVPLVFSQSRGELDNKFILAQNYEQAGDFETAIKIYEELNQIAPSSSQYYSSLNRLYVQLKNYAASVNLLENRTIVQPDDITAYGMLGSTYYLMGNEEKAKEIWFKPFDILKPDPVFYRVIANYAVERRAFDIAIELFKSGKNISPDKLIFSQDLAQLYAITMQFKLAAEEYCSILDSEPLQLEAVKSKMLAYSGKPGALEASIDVVEDYTQKSNLSLSYLLAHLYTEAKLYDKAFETYLTIDRAQANQGADLFKYAEFLLREKQHSLSEEAYKSTIELYPNSMFIPLSKLGYAKALEAQLMEDYYSKVPNWKPYFPIVRYDSENIQKVLDAFKEIVNVYGRSEASYEAMFRMGMLNYYLQKNSSEAFKNFNLIISEAPTSTVSIETYMIVGDIKLLEGDIKEAEKYYSKVLSSPGSGKEFMNSAKYKLARINFYNGEFDKAKKQLIEITVNLKDDFANDALELLLLLNSSVIDSANILKFAEAEFLKETRKFEEAAEIYKLISQDPRALVLYSISSLRFAQMMIAVDKYTEGITAFESMVEAGEKNIFADKALYLISKTYQYGVGDKLKAIESYERLLMQFPNSIYLDNARAEIFLLKNKLS